MKKQKAFTLVELLVVIAVIGLLSAIVLISIKSSRDKAEEKKNMQFSASIQHSLGAYTLGSWSLDGNLNDSSGNGNTGLWNGDENYVNGIINKAASFSAGDIFIPFRDKLLSKSGAITIEFWAYINSYYPSYSTFINQYDGSEEYYSSYGCSIEEGDYICFLGVSDMYTYFETSLPVLNKWFHTVLSYDGKGNAKMFLNGKKIDFDYPDATGKMNNAGELSIGTEGVNMLMDEVRIYDSYINFSEVQKHYAEGLMKIGLAEYYDKINENNSL